MIEELVPLEKPDKLDSKDWNIDFGKLLTPKRGVSPYIFLSDRLYESPDGKYACLVYTIFESSMGSYTGLIGLFEDKQTPILLTNPRDQWFSSLGDRTLRFDNNLLFLRKPAYNENSQISGTPFVVFDLSKKQFGFIDFDGTSIYYSLLHNNGTKYKINLDTPNEIANRSLPNRHGETIDIANIKFYTFDQLDKLLELYWEEKRNKE